MFTFNYANLDDLTTIMNIIDQSLPLLPNSDWFVGDTAEFYSRHMGCQGFTLKAVSQKDKKMAAFFLVRYPKLEEDNCGYDLSFSEDDLQKTAHMEVCVVHPDYRGNHLESILMTKAVEILKTTEYCHLFGTVHPDNIPSVKAFLQNDFTIAKTTKKYGGKLRHIMYKKL